MSKRTRMCRKVIVHPQATHGAPGRPAYRSGRRLSAHRAAAGAVVNNDRRSVVTRAKRETWDVEFGTGVDIEILTGA